MSLVENESVLYESFQGVAVAILLGALHAFLACHAWTRGLGQQQHEQACGAKLTLNSWSLWWGAIRPVRGTAGSGGPKRGRDTAG